MENIRTSTRREKKEGMSVAPLHQHIKFTEAVIFEYKCGCWEILNLFSFSLLTLFVSLFFYLHFIIIA